MDKHSEQKVNQIKEILDEVLDTDGHDDLGYWISSDSKDRAAIKIATLLASSTGQESSIPVCSEYNLECGLSKDEWILEQVVDKVRSVPTLEAIGILRKINKVVYDGEILCDAINKIVDLLPVGRGKNNEALNIIMNALEKYRESYSTSAPPVNKEGLEWIEILDKDRRYKLPDYDEAVAFYREDGIIHFALLDKDGNDWLWKSDPKYTHWAKVNHPGESLTPSASIVSDIGKQIDYIKRNAEKVGEHTWQTYKDQILGHVEDAKAFLSASLPVRGETAEVKALVESAKNVIENMFWLYTAKNGKKASIEDSSGEKCWIVPDDAIEILKAALAAYKESRPSIPISSDIVERLLKANPYKEARSSDTVNLDKSSAWYQAVATLQTTLNEEGKKEEGK